MDKIVDIDSRLVSKRLGSIEPTVQVLQLGQSNGVKTASAASEWARSVKPQPGKTYILVLALGASEWYGPNRNGDGFTEDWLRRKHLTFETNAKVYKSHQNKADSPSYGKVIKSFYNEDMHRVELVLEIDNASAPDIVEKVNNGEQIACSMGCRISADVCSICANRAPKRSDYCFVPDTKVTMADGTRRLIQDIQVGDFVLSASGLPTRVVELFVRGIDEDIVELTTSLSIEKLRLTKNHPVLSAHREELMCFYKTYTKWVRSCYRGTVDACSSCMKPPECVHYIEAGALRVEDAAYAPGLNFNEKETTLADEEAYILGLFMAEGSYAKQGGKRSSVQFSLHQDETLLIDAVKAFAARFGREAKVYQPKVSKGVSVRIHSIEAAEFFYRYCGEYAQAKFAKEIPSQPKGIIQSYLRGLWDGDGYSLIREGRKDVYRLNTASENLAWQTAVLLRGLGYTAYVGTALVPGGPTTRSNKFTQWYVSTNFGAVSPTVRTVTENGIQSGTVRELSTVSYSGPVHNFETEDHSYVAGGIAVHNCTHAQFQLNDILPDGRIVYVDNPDPTFFDISIVWRPADRTGYMLKKVADVASRPFIGSSAELAEKLAHRTVLASLLRKVADIDKIVTGVGIGSEANLTSQWVDQVVPKVLSNYKPVENSDLGWLSGKNFPRVMATLSRMGIFLATPEFLDLFFLKATGRPATPGLAQKLISVQGDIFGMMAKNPSIAEMVLGSGILGDTGTESLPDVEEKMAAYLPHRDWSEAGLKKLAYNPYKGGNLETQSYTDQASGRTFVTSNDAIDNASEKATQQDLMSLLGSAALAATTYLALSPFIHSTVLKALPAGVVGVAMASRLRQPRIPLDNGDTAPGVTPFMERRAEFIPQTAVKLASNYARMGKRRVTNSPITAFCKTAACANDEISVDDLSIALGYLLTRN